MCGSATSARDNTVRRERLSWPVLRGGSLVRTGVELCEASR